MSHLSSPHRCLYTGVCTQASLCVHGQACVCMGRLVYVCVHSTVAVLKQSCQNRNCLLLSLAEVLPRLMWRQGALDVTCNTPPSPPPRAALPPGHRGQQAGHWYLLVLAVPIGPWSRFQPHSPRAPCMSSPISYPPGSISSLELAICRKRRAAARSSHSSSRE